MVNSQPSALEGLAQSVAHEAGAVLLDMRSARLDPARKSSSADWVSRADHKAEQVITTGLRAHRPDDGLLAEEGTRRPSASGYTWIIDPLDGTANYLRGYPGWAVSVAVRDAHGQILAGVVHEPTTATTWTARVDAKSRRNGEVVSVNSPTVLDEMVIGTGFSYQREERARQADQLRTLLPRLADLRRCGSAALELCRVADGSLDAFVESDLEVWDWAAGGLLVQRAGGVCMPWQGATVSGVLAGPPTALELLAPLLDVP